MIGGGLTCNKSKTYLWKIVSSYLLGALSTTNLIQEKETWNYTFPDIWKIQSEEELMHPPGATLLTKEALRSSSSTFIKFRRYR